MNGQGRPHRGFRCRAVNRDHGRWRIFAILVAFAALPIPLLRAEPATPQAAATVRLRLAWGGGTPQTWSGRVRVVPGGMISELRLLGLDADSPGSMWTSGDTLHVGRRTPRRYDGLECDVTAPPNSELEIELRGDSEQARVIRVPLQLVTTGTFRELLDEERNFFLAHRAPGDDLRVTHNYQAMIFRVGENFDFEVHPHQLATANDGLLDIVADLMPARSEEPTWSATEVSQPLDGNREPIAFSVPLPDREGVYDVRLRAYEPQGLAGRLVPGVGRRPVATRRLQVLVIDPRQNRARSSSAWRSLLTIDPANPRWWSRLPKWLLVDRLPGTTPRAISNASHTTFSHSLGRLLELPPRRPLAEPSWHALMIPIDEVGVPHLIEVELPSDTPLDLAISILEPNAAGRVVPLNRDFGVVHDPDEATAEPRMLSHRFIFWPRTAAPVVLLANRHETAAAFLGKLEVFVHAGPLERTTPIYAPASGARIVAAHLERPHFTASLGAKDYFDVQGGYAIEDWQTFFDGGTRLVEYLSFAGYNAAFVSVMADGSGLYPSPLIQPNPTHDTGSLSTLGQDPLRKDVLQMLLRQFTRDGLLLFPCLSFNAPLPAIEKLRHDDAETPVGILPIGRSGQVSSSSGDDRRPRYNIFSPLVQNAIRDVIRELTQRYRDHPSMAGIAIELSSDSLLTSPGLDWGLDDATIAAFEADTQTEVPDEGPDRYAARAKFLLGEGRDAWIAWRCLQLTNFYGQLQAIVAESNPDRKLYLLPARLIDDLAFLPQHLPRLRDAAELPTTLQTVGLDLEQLARAPGIVVVRPYQGAFTAPIAESGVGWNLNRQLEFDKALKESTPQAAMFFSRTTPLRLPSFDAQSPFGSSETYTSLLPHPSALTASGRHPMTHAVSSLDDDMLIDSGLLLPTVDNPALRHFRNTYRQLPSHAAMVSERREQSVTVRTYEEPGGAVIAVLNDSPWPVTAKLTLQAPAGCTLVELGERGDRSRPRTFSSGEGGMAWYVELGACELQAARFSSAAVRPVSVAIENRGKVADWLATRVDALKERVSATSTARALAAFEAGGFEIAADLQPISGWNVEPAEAADNVALDLQHPHSGQSALRVAATEEVVSLVSEPFASPTTGRLGVHFWVKTAAADQQPAVRIVVEDADKPIRYQQYAVVGGNYAGSVRLETRWWWYELQLDTLPLRDTQKLRIRIDVAGEGTIWIDDVAVFDLVFNEVERRELLKIVYAAHAALQDGMLSECADILDGYWPRYLAQHAPSESARIDPPSSAPPLRPATEPSVADRLKGFVPRWLR